MTNDELNKLEQDLVLAFPEWFSVSTIDRQMVCWRPQLQPYPIKPYLNWVNSNDAFLGACLDAAHPRGWTLCVGNSHLHAGRYNG
jgi:hypothetical protein